VTAGNTDSGDKWPLGDLRLVIAFEFGTGESVASAPSSRGNTAFEYSGGQARPINSWSSKLDS